MSIYSEKRKWSDQFMPEVKEIVGKYIMTFASIEDDVNRNTDLTIIGAMPVRIACRVRSGKYLERYGDQFTLRTGVISGNETEFGKVMKGFGDFIFYGIANQEETAIQTWFIGDLSVFRLWYVRCLEMGDIKWQNLSNGDGSGFKAFTVSYLPKEFIVARS